jgi:hypothetical protein
MCEDGIRPSLGEWGGKERTGLAFEKDVRLLHFARGMILPGPKRIREGLQAAARP